MVVGLRVVIRLHKELHNVLVDVCQQLGRQVNVRHQLDILLAKFQPRRQHGWESLYEQGKKWAYKRTDHAQQMLGTIVLRVLGMGVAFVKRQQLLQSQSL